MSLKPEQRETVRGMIKLGIPFSEIMKEPYIKTEAQLMGYFNRMGVTPREIDDNNQESQKPEPQKQEPQEPEPQKPEPQKPEPQKPEPQKPEPQKPEPQKPEPQKPEPQKPEPQKPEPQDNSLNSLKKR